MLTPAEQDEIRSIQAMCQMVLEKTKKLLPEATMNKKKTKKQLFQEDMDRVWAKRIARLNKKAALSSGINSKT